MEQPSNQQQSVQDTPAAEDSQWDRRMSDEWG